MKENLKDFLFNLFVSSLIGLFVGMLEVTITNMSSMVVATLITDSLIGAFIGTISMFTFIYIFEMKEMDIKIAFIAVFMIIGIISSTPSIYLYFIQNINISIVRLMSIVISAEFLGMSLCYYSYKKCLELNSKLVNKKKQFSQK
ncbi:hypothetical protein Ccar_07700 [Clostridium carboxidivorans P7]|uniref:Uncharacterized protein n=1 Tax=Clostridium carboxidivorans P7 TaxID=536227 RepID=C6PVA0_9CLOT|nr:hypothetical protein [Clostridium carboxidivorans]AKN30724.1 hypothetical protein Ccar_07700 [Clostridium carboxidivorans P7]EET86830.1 conserved hypothetical protein [Clostridium carboxidivorans P7]EFG88574.1 hypothetical protein CLCAR_1796 [Clostridium carboxidivorans P7]